MKQLTTYTATMFYVLATVVNSLIMSSLATNHYDPCIWKVSVISSSDLDVTEVPLQNDRELVSLQETLERLQVNNMSPEKQTTYYSYPYFLHLNVLCKDQISSQMSRTLVAMGVHPQVTIAHRPRHIDGCHDGGKIKYTMTGALVDLDQDQHRQNECDGMSLCHPSWVIPFIMDECSVMMQVYVDSGSVDRLVLPTRHLINADGYKRVSPDGSTFQSTLGTYLEIEDLDTSILLHEKPHRITSIPSATPMLVIGGIGQSNTVIVSAKEFDKYEVIQVTVPPTTITCQDSDTLQHIKQAISLPDRILFSTPGGLFEIFGFYGFLQGITPSPSSTLTPILPGYCIRESVLTTHTYTEHVVILVIGSQAGKEVVLTATVQTGISLAFKEVVDENQATACEFIAQPGSSCSILAGGISGVHKGQFVLLLLVKDTDEMWTYYLVSIEDTSEGDLTSFSDWITLSSFSATHIHSAAAGHHHPIQLSPFEETPQLIDVNLNITGLTFIGLVSQHMFMWGNFLLYSPDGGVSVFLLTQYTSSSKILSLSVSHTNTFAFINDQRELWYGIVSDTVALHRLRPSAGWTIQFSTVGLRHSEEAQYGNEENTLTLFFDHSDQLFELIATKNESNGKVDVLRRAVSISDIVTYDIYTTAYDTDGWRNISSFSSCPFLSIFFEASINQFNERIQQFIFSKPHLTDPMQTHTKDSLMVYQGIVHQAILQSLQDKPKGVVALYDPVARWKASKAVLKDYYEWLYRTKMVQSGIHVPIEEYGKFYEGNDHVDDHLPSVVYLDLGSSFNFSVYLSLDLPDVHNVALDSLWVTVDVSDISRIEVLVTRIVNYLTNHVIYHVRIQDKGMLEQQSLPGLRLHPASVFLQAWNSAFKCTQHTDMNEEELQGSYSMNVLLGCAPGTRLIFDLNSTLEYATGEFGVIYDCPAIRTNPDMPCFYYKQGFHPFFQVLDLVTGRAERFTGNYTLRVVGGSQGDVTDIKYFNQKEQEVYNLQDHGEDETLIWIPIEGAVSKTSDSAVIFNHKHNGVLWSCQQYSACSDIPLKFPYAPEYYFLMEVSNGNVDASRTYCNYTIQFIIRVHGFPISPLRSIRIVLWTFFILCISLLMFVVWNQNKQHPFIMSALRKMRPPKIAPAIVVEDTDSSCDTRYQREEEYNLDRLSIVSSEQVLDVYMMESAVFRKVQQEQQSNYSIGEGFTNDLTLPSGDAVPLRPSMVTSAIPEESSHESHL